MPKTKDNDPYQRFLEKKHEGFVTPEKLIAEMVAKATGSEFVEKRKIIEGEMNEVYDVTTSDKQNVIVRISRWKYPTLEAEEKIIRLVRMIGVPAPKVLLIEQASSESKKLTFCIEEKMDGVPLKNLMKSMDKETLKPFITEAGRMLSKINSLSVEMFGLQDGSDSYKTWKDFIFNLENKRDKIIKAGKTVGADNSLIVKAFLLLRENEEMFDAVEPKLLHGDYSPKHWMVKDKIVKDKKIVGIIDFEGAKGGDPVRDIAWVSYFYSKAFPIEWLTEGYENKELFDKNFDLKMKLYRLHISLDLLQYFQAEKNISGMTFAKRRLGEDMKTWYLSPQM
jgi:aminoglycoside phosphotransferase (APT) family kinase protein